MVLNDGEYLFRLLGFILGWNFVLVSFFCGWFFLSYRLVMILVWKDGDN